MTITNDIVIIAEVPVDVPIAVTIGAAAGITAAGQVTSASLTGVIVPVSGFLSADEYQVILTYAGDMKGNGLPYYIKTASHFTIYHHGATVTQISYIVVATT